MDSFLLLYQLARSGEKASKQKAQSLWQACLKTPENFDKIGVPAWQLRWLIKRLDLKSGQSSFERKIWPQILSRYALGPVSDFYFGLSAAIFSMDPDRDPFKPVLKSCLKRMEKELIEVDGIYGWSAGGSPLRMDLGAAHGLTGSALALSLISKRLGPSPGLSRLTTRLELSFDRIYSKGEIEVLKTLPELKEPRPKNRIGWCRSDLSTGIGLIVAGRRLKSARLIELGQKFLSRTKNKSPARLYTENPYLCHGSAGNQYLFYVAHELSGDPWFSARALSAAKVTQRYLSSKKFPRHPVGAAYHLMDLRNTKLVQRSISKELDRSWDIVFAFRDPYDLSLS